MRGGIQLTPQDGRVVGACAEADRTNAPAAIMIEDFILTDFGTKEACRS